MPQKLKSRINGFWYCRKRIVKIFSLKNSKGYRRRQVQKYEPCYNLCFTLFLTFRLELNATWHQKCLRVQSPSQEMHFLRIDMYALALVMWEILSRCTAASGKLQHEKNHLKCSKWHCLCNADYKFLIGIKSFLCYQCLTANLSL